MKHIRGYYFLLLSLGLGLLLAGCALANNSIVVLWTNRAEFVAYAEVFNSIQSQYKLEIKYKDNPAQALGAKANMYPDLVISEGLAGREFLDKFDSLNDLMNGRIDSALFYKALLNIGMQGGAHRLLPVNFNLPAIVFKPENLQKSIPSLLITLDEIKENSRKFRQETGTRLSTLGFSPLWNEHFLYYAAIALGLDLKPDKNNQLSWNEKAALEASSFLREWIKGPDRPLDEELKLQEEFKKQYLAIPEYQLLRNDRILFSYMDIRDFLKAPPEKVEKLDFRWLSAQNKIPVLDDIVFTGVYTKGKNKKGAKEFLVWFFRLDTQIHLLEVNHIKRLRGVFGLANGFSALKEINEKELHKPQKYPLFVEHIPREEQLLFPAVLVGNTQTFKKQLIKELLAVIKQQKQEFKISWPVSP